MGKTASCCQSCKEGGSCEAGGLGGCKRKTCAGSSCESSVEDDCFPTCRSTADCPNGTCQLQQFYSDAGLTQLLFVPQYYQTTITPQVARSGRQIVHLGSIPDPFGPLNNGNPTSNVYVGLCFDPTVSNPTYDVFLASFFDSSLPAFIATPTNYPSFAPIQLAVFEVDNAGTLALLALGLDGTIKQGTFTFDVINNQYTVTWNTLPWIPSGFFVNINTTTDYVNLLLQQAAQAYFFTSVSGAPAFVPTNSFVPPSPFSLSKKRYYGSDFSNFFEIDTLGGVLLWYPTTPPSMALLTQTYGDLVSATLDPVPPSAIDNFVYISQCQGAMYAAVMTTDVNGGTSPQVVYLSRSRCLPT